MTRFMHTQRIAIAEGNNGKLIPHLFSTGRKLRTVQVKFRIAVEEDGTYSATPVRLPDERYVASLFGEAVELEPDAALLKRLVDEASRMRAAA